MSRRLRDRLLISRRNSIKAITGQIFGGQSDDIIKAAGRQWMDEIAQKHRTENESAEEEIGGSDWKTVDHE